jgi:general secretion pathway protein I
VLAVALAAGMRAVAQAADGATMLKQRTLALWVAQNRLAAAQLEAAWPTPGRREGGARQAGSGFVWRETVTETPNPAFRKIEIVVADPGEPDYVLARLAGYLGRPPQQ